MLLDISPSSGLPLRLGDADCDRNARKSLGDHEDFLVVSDIDRGSHSFGGAGDDVLSRSMTGMAGGGRGVINLLFGFMVLMS